MVILLQKQTCFQEARCFISKRKKSGLNLGADFRTHEEDVGDPEADRYQAE